jgi:hypothetical protein
MTALGVGLGVTALAARPAVTDAPSAGSDRLAWAAEVAQGQADGVALAADQGLRLALARAASLAEAPYAVAGTLVGPLRPLPAPTAVAATWTGETPAGTSVLLEVRGRRADGLYSEWEELPDRGGVAPLPWAAQAVQYRLTLLAAEGAPSPVVRDVAIQPLATTATLENSAAAAATHRVYATRIGLIGNQTSNGHVIVPEDRFVALPSRRALATRGGDEYQVRVEYKGRRLTLPVWDTGPWNVRDNYWDTSVRRDMWNDLPQGQPQAAAAYYDAYHGGRDGFGRRVLSPAGIDLSDAAFYELGMTQSDWVTVTFLWLDADE